MKICLYTATALPKIGGQELMVDALARELVGRGHEVTVLSPMPRGRDASGDVNKPYRMVRHPRFVSTRWFVGWYRRYLKRLGPFDVVHCQEAYPTGYLAVLARRETGVPVVITSHGGDLNEGNVRIVKPGVLEKARMAVLGADQLVSIGRFTEANFQRVAGSGTLPKLVEIPNGVHLRELSGGVAKRPEGVRDEPYVLFLGRLHRRKGVDVLVEAVKGTNVRVLVVGDGDLRAELEGTATDGNVQFLGKRFGEEKTWLLRNARAVVMPSRGWEAFPLVVLEAAAAARAVVASRIAGLEDLVVDGITGRLFEEGNVEGLRKALLEVWEQPEVTEAWGRNAFERAKGYDWPLIAERYERVYRDVMKQAAP